MITNAVALAEEVAFGQSHEISPEAAAWLRQGLLCFLRGDADLLVALRLTGGARLAARNRALRCAADIIDDGRGLSAWQLAGLLESAVCRFQSRVLPRLSREDRSAPSPLDCALLEAFRAGPRVMTSRRRLFDLLN